MAQVVKDSDCNTDQAETTQFKLDQALPPTPDVSLSHSSTKQIPLNKTPTIESKPAAGDLKPPSKIARKLVYEKKPSAFTFASADSPQDSTDIKTIKPSKIQPSKTFIAKCWAEQKTLTDVIRPSFNEEIKALSTDENFTDLLVEIDHEFKRSLHQCIVAARCFKVYAILKQFRSTEAPQEVDIIVKEFQEKLAVCEESESSTKLVDLSTISDELAKIEDNDNGKNPPSALICRLPDGLISADLFSILAKRIYLDTDITEEEIKLNKTSLDWFKVHSPEVIRTPNKYSPDHRLSFRTIQPDYDCNLSTSSGIRSPTMSQQLITLADSDDVDIDDNTQASSVKDESLNNSLLPRTETFDRMDKNIPNGPAVNSPAKNLSSPQLDDSTATDDAQDDTTTKQEDYAPTTRTGLKPKKFTTPTGCRTQPRTPPVSDRAKIIGTKIKPVTRDETPIKPAKTATSSPRSSLSSSSSKKPQVSDSSDNSTSRVNPSKPKATPITTPKAKNTMITRAQPISMERSQSPGMKTTINTVRNLAPSRRVPSLSEKKSPEPIDRPLGHDAEIETTLDSSILDSMTFDELLANLDKYALISYTRLADALSKLFIDGSLTDTIITTRDNKIINAHRCILAARSAYLAECIAKQKPQGSLSSSSQNPANQITKIDLTEFSYSAVYFSILHIYSGVVKVPDDLELAELTKVTHHLHISTLKQVCIHNLKMSYCHFFHKPCNVCSIGVLKTLPLAWRYDLTDLYTKCLQWIGTNFSSIFCLKEFSELKPQDLIEECYNATLNQLTPDNIIGKTIECQKLLKSLPKVKWAESIICLVGRQLEDFCHYVADNYEKILQSDSFSNLGKTCWECEILEENLLAAMNHLKPDSGCRTLIELDRIECSSETYSDQARAVSESFTNLISKMRKYCERYLLNNAAAVVHCNSWKHMSVPLQKRIKDQAILSTDFEEPIKHLASKPKLLSMSRVSNQQQSPNQTGLSSSPAANTSGPRSSSNRSTPESRLKSPNTTYLPPPKHKTAAARHVKVLK